MGRLTYTTAEVQERLDTAGELARDNLLDNWYLAGSGSQIGAWGFPINQRGQSSYAGLGYSVDRWNVANATITVTLGSDGLVMTSTSGMPSGYRLFEQYLENGPKAGETYTISMLVSACSGTFSLLFGSKGASSNRIRSSDISSAGLVSVTGTFANDCTDPFFGIGSRVSGVTSLTIVAVKVERGATQTLAHPDGNGGWVLNKTPIYQQELARCQRFLLHLGTYGRFPTTRFATGEIDFLVPTPVTIRTTPTISGSPSVYSGTTSQTGFTFTVSTKFPNGVLVRGTKASHGLTDTGVFLYSNGTMLTAEL